MWKLVLSFFFVSCIHSTATSQNKSESNSKFFKESFGLQTGLSLLENPLVFYPIVSFSYSRVILGTNRHQLAVLPRVGAIVLSQIETKFLLSTSVEYKYVARKRLEASFSLGVNYQLRRLAYDRYEFSDNRLKNKGRLLHQVGPIIGMQVGYRIVKRSNFSLSPNIGFSLIKLNKIYRPNLFEGYKPSIFLGLTFNK